MILNINDTVKVKLNDHGRKILKGQNTLTYQGNTHIYQEISFVENEERYSKR